MDIEKALYRWQDTLEGSMKEAAGEEKKNDIRERVTGKAVKHHIFSHHWLAASPESLVMIPALLTPYKLQKVYLFWDIDIDIIFPREDGRFIAGKLTRFIS